MATCSGFRFRTRVKQFTRSFLTHVVRSGCRESNPVYIHPMDAYYRYTTARYLKTEPLFDSGSSVTDNFLLKIFATPTHAVALRLLNPNLSKAVCSCLDSNPVYIHPMDAYYRYTTARLTYITILKLLVGMLGIEPSLHAPEACVLPVYYIPKSQSPLFLCWTFSLT